MIFNSKRAKKADPLSYITSFIIYLTNILKQLEQNEVQQPIESVLNRRTQTYDSGLTSI